MNIMKMMIVAIVLGFTSVVMADIETPSWEDDIRQPAMPPICLQIKQVRANPTVQEPASQLAMALFGLLGKPEDPIRQFTCGEGEGSLSLQAGVDIVDEIIRTLREASLTPYSIEPRSGAGVRAALLEDVRRQVTLNREGAGAENGGANDAVQRAMREYNFTPAELGFTPEEIKKLPNLEE